MNKEQYLAKREELVNKSQKLIDEGKAKESKEVNEEIKNLDNKFELSAKVQANLNALKDNHSITDIQNYGVNVEGRTIDSIAKDNVEKPDMYDSVEYRKSFMNYVLTGARMPGKFGHHGTHISP